MLEVADMEHWKIEFNMPKVPRTVCHVLPACAAHLRLFARSQPCVKWASLDSLAISRRNLLLLVLIGRVVEKTLVYSELTRLLDVCRFKD